MVTAARFGRMARKSVLGIGLFVGAAGWFAVAAWGGDPASPLPLQNLAGSLGTHDRLLPVLQPAADPAPSVSESAISVVGATEGNTVGLLDPTSDLGDDLWSSTPRGVVVDLLAAGALSTSDPAVRDLARRVVLTKADAPSGAARRAVITVRIEQLLRAGMIEEAGALASRSVLADDADFARVQANALLYAGRGDDVCSDRTALRLSSGEPFWVELRAYCAAMAGDATLTELTLAALDAQGGDEAFKILLADVQNKKVIAPKTYARPSALYVFLLRKLKLPIPAALAAMGGTPENLYLLRDRRCLADQRLQAAERIVRTGAATAAELRAVADVRSAPTAPEAAHAETLAPSLPFLAAQVLLRRTAQVDIHPERREALIALALHLADAAGQLPLAAAFQGDLLAAMAPGKPDNAPIIARALLLTGDAKSAVRWLAWDETLHAAATALMADPASLPTHLARYAAQPGSDPYKSLILAMTGALGLLPAGGADVSLAGKRPEAETLAQLQAAAATPGRKGEALLVMLDQIQALGWREMSPDVSVTFVRLLKSMGYGDVAQAFAREAVLMYAPVSSPAAQAPQ